MPATKKKRQRDKDMPIMHQPIDWVRIIQAIAIAITTIMSTWAAIQMQQSAYRQQRVEAKLSEVADQGSGAMTAAKKDTAILATALAAETQDPKDVKVAEEAKADYEAQAAISKQTRSELPAAAR